MSESLPPVTPAGIELAPGIRATGAALRWQFARGSGPGGQNVNKVNTKAELWVTIQSLTGLPPRAADRLRGLAGSRLTLADEIHLSSDEHRSQETNRAEVLERIRLMLIQALHEPKRRRKTRPTFASKQRRLEGKKHRAELKTGRGGRFEKD